MRWTTRQAPAAEQLKLGEWSYGRAQHRNSPGIGDVRETVPPTGQTLAHCKERTQQYAVPRDGSHEGQNDKDKHNDCGQNAGRLAG